MAIFHLRHKFLSRSSGASSLAKAAYNAAEKISDNKGSSEGSDFTRKGGVLCNEITLPRGSPEWADNRGELWRRLEAREDRSTRRKDAILAHSFDISLPCELTLEQNIFLAKDFVREQFTRNGYPVDWSIHGPDPRGDDRNIHLHILVPLRHIEGDSFGIKDRFPKSKLRAQIRTWRSAWATLANRHLKRYGYKSQIDERSLREQGIKRTPSKPRGVRPKVKRSALDALRPPQPKAPIVSQKVSTNPDGSVIIRAAIRGTALTKIGREDFSQAAISPPERKGWPEAAIRDWGAWGKKNPQRFFALWPELAPEGFIFGEGAQP